jgi:excisionase family DNA binding protein
MNEIVLISVPIEDLVEKISIAISKMLIKARDEKNPSSNKTLLSRFEVAKLLKISLPTLNQWSKHGLLNSYKIGHRVLYKQDEIEIALRRVNEIKHKRNLI